jgi:glycosyltransferase involved in cell wall biosynthesis
MMSSWAMGHHRFRKILARGFVHPGAFKAVDGWHATSEQERLEIRALELNQPICVAPNGVHEPSEAEVSASRNFWREACPETAHRPVALFYSRFHRKKRVCELIQAWKNSGPRDWLLLLVGIPEEFTAEELAESVVGPSGAGRIRVFSGRDRPAPYPVASLFLLPSHNENFGLVVAEALAHGVPALVTDSTPWAALGENGAGWSVPWAGYEAALKLATGEASERLRERGERGRLWMRRDFSWDKSAQILAEFYGQLASGRS